LKSNSDSPSNVNRFSESVKTEALVDREGKSRLMVRVLPDTESVPISVELCWAWSRMAV